MGLAIVSKIWKKTFDYPSRVFFHKKKVIKVKENTEKMIYDKGKTYVNASVEAARNKTYPIVRPLYYYYPTSKETSVKTFIDYVLSPEGQEIVNKVGYISLK